MMRKVFTTVVLCIGLFANANAQYNLFDPADVDADGWLWFDTQEKIDKYIGQADNDNMIYDENGKLIQLVCADIMDLDYPDSEASADFIGVGTDGNIGGTDAKKGAIKIAPASGFLSTDGGGFAIKMPSCTSFNIMLSCGNKMYARLLGFAQAGKKLNEYKYLFGPNLWAGLASAGHYTWVNMHTLYDKDPSFTLNSSSTIYAFLQSVNNKDLYVHGIKVLTSTPSGIDNVIADSFGYRFDGQMVSLNKDADMEVFTLQGILMKSVSASVMDVRDLIKGVYVLKLVDKITGETHTQKLIVR